MTRATRWSWLLSHALLAGLAVLVFHVLILRTYAERPLALSAWLLLASALVVAHREMARGTDPTARTRLQRAWAGLDNDDLLLLAFFFLLLVAFSFGYLRATADGREYFAQVRSLVIDHDLSFANENQLFRSSQPETFPFGSAVLWTPFFLAAHFWLGALNLAGAELPRNGFANPYQMAVGLGTLVYGCAGLVLMVRIARDYFAARIAVVAAVLVTAGSFLVWYLAIEGSYSHGTSMFAATLFVFVWHRTRTRRSTRQWLWLGLAGGLMTMVRWQNVVFLLFPLIDGIEEVWKAPRSGWLRVGRSATAFGAAFWLAFSPQLLFWKVVNGGWLTLPPSQTGEHWWASPLVAEVLFSADHGLFAWHPLLFLAVLGVPLFVARDLRLGGLLALVFVTQVYINGAVAMWWGGHAFGARRFDSCVLLFVLGLAALLSWVQRRPLAAAAAVMLLLVLANAFFIADIRAGRLPTGQGIGFDQIFNATYERLGNPFSLPASALFAHRWGISPRQYDSLGLRTFNNLHLDMGSGAEAPYLGYGWSGPERNDDVSFRWAVGTESIVVAPLRSLGADPGQAPYRVTLRAEAFAFEGAAEQTLELWANDGLAGRRRISGAMRDYVIDVPAELLGRHLNVFRLRYAWAHVPADGRAEELAVRFERIDFIRQPH